MVTDSGPTSKTAAEELLDPPNPADDPSKVNEGKKPGDEGYLYAGKYKTVEEMEKGYRETSGQSSTLSRELAEEKAKNEKLIVAKEPKPDDKPEEVSVDQLREAYKKDSVATVLWMLKNMGREETLSIVKGELDGRTAVATEANTRAELATSYPDLKNKESELFKLSAQLYDKEVAEKVGKAKALKNAVEMAALKLGVSPAQKEEAQRQLNVDGNLVEPSSRGRPDTGGKIKLTDEEARVASKLGIKPEDYQTSLEGQGGRRVRVSRRA